MKETNLKFKSLAKTLSSNTEDIKNKLSAHLSETILNVLSKKQVINSDNKEEIQAKVETTTKKLVKEIAKGKINSDEQVSKLIENAVEDITGNASVTSEEGENSRSVMLFAATTVNQLDNSPLVKSISKAVIKKLTNVALDTLDNVPVFTNSIQKMKDSSMAMHFLNKLDDIDIPVPLFGDMAEEVIDQLVAYVNGQTPAA
jgi:hypothetical protein